MSENHDDVMTPKHFLPKTTDVSIIIKSPYHSTDLAHKIKEFIDSIGIIQWTHRQMIGEKLVDSIVETNRLLNILLQFIHTAIKCAIIIYSTISTTRTRYDA